MSGVVCRHSSSIGSSHGGTALILDRLGFRIAPTLRCCGGYQSPPPDSAHYCFAADPIFVL
jgi:hypothetical protein